MPTDTELAIQQFRDAKRSDWQQQPDDDFFLSGPIDDDSSEPLPPGTTLIGHLDEYIVIAELGGICGSYKATARKDKTLVFAKAYNRASDKVRTFWYPRERQALRALAPHDITAPIIDTGRENALLILPYIEGSDLSETIADALNADATRSILKPIAEKLSRAHQLNWVNRDLKPQNIRYETADTSYQRPALNDWGFSYNTDLHKDETHELGTVLYRSPEQLSETPFADKRSDLYSLGIILFELLTGKHPRKHLPPIEQISAPKLPYNPREFKPDADLALTRITIRATQPDPERRYQSADEMLEDLKTGTNR